MPDGNGTTRNSATDRQPAAFDDPVPDDGYRWWYLDAVSDDGLHALTAIVFIGSVFSPWYRRARSRGPAAALEHCAINLALYGPVERWCMTERSARHVSAGAASLSVGSSRLSLDEERLVLDIDERCMPLPRRLRGRIVAQVPDTMCAEPLWLDESRQHRWQALAPQTRVRVSMQDPALNWSGTAYVDSNRGAAPLESAFRTWHWSRSHASDGSTRVRYDVIDRAGREHARTLDIRPDGTTSEGPAGQSCKLPATRWFRMQRPTRLAQGARAEQLQTLENAPFYSRSRLIEAVDGEHRQTVHESLDMNRFTRRSTQWLLPFRAPRRP